MHAQFYLLYAMSRSYCIIFMYWSLVTGCRPFLLSRDCAHPFLSPHSISGVPEGAARGKAHGAGSSPGGHDCVVVL